MLTIMTLLGTGMLHAQITHSQQGAVDRRAETVLKLAAAQFDNNVSFSVTLTVLDPQQKQTMKQTAQVLYHRGRYHLTVADQEVVSDGKVVWQWNKKAREVCISDVGSSDIDLFNPAGLLSNYATNFRAKYIRTDTDGTAVIDLQPRSAQSYHKLRLLVDEKTGQLRRLEVHRFDSGREYYDVSKFTKAKTPDSKFTFNVAGHPEVEIIDMR